MRSVRDLPEPVRHVENTFIVLSDGTRLAARVWMPASADEAPVPAVLEYIPYRKRDWMRLRDDTMHPYFAGHGYAAVRVDLRGSGDSEGLLTDEYLAQELDDGVEVIEWIAAQPWCNGRVGMIGISWGGFNGLQIAARQPEALGAVVTWCSTDDRYADDVHYMGGCLLGDNLSWSAVMFSLNSCPPDPEIVGDRWRKMWMERLDGSDLWLETWLEHQHRDDYWRHGSVCEDFSRIRAPVLAGSGWADGYSNAVFRLLAGLDVPRRGIIGPWSHKYPHIGVPGPAVGYLQECLRWWDRWLKDEDNGVDDEPMLRVFMQDHMPPCTGYETRAGRWVAEPTWPSANIEPRRYRLAPRGLVSAEAPREGGEPSAYRHSSPLTLGQYGGKWCSYAAPPDLPDDQREEDGGAAVFETAPLEARLEILGAPVLELDVACDRPVGQVCARLTDVAPDGKATRVSYGVLNLTHRDGHAAPEALVPGQTYRVRLQLNHVAQAFEPGHRVRLALSSSYWPVVWPPPEVTELTFGLETSELALPVRAPRPEEDARLRPFGPPEGTPPPEVMQRTEPDLAWRVTRDLATNSSQLEVVQGSGRKYLPEIDLEMEKHCLERYALDHDDLNSIRGVAEWTQRFERGGWRVHTRTKTILTSGPSSFRLRAECDAWEDDTRVFTRSWDLEVLRKLV